MSSGEGFTLSGRSLADHPEIAKLTSALQAPQAALRARLNAVILDLILLGVVSQLLLRGESPGTRAGLFLVLEFAYFFVFEMWRGQTIGKRLFGVRVTTVDGSRARPAQIALRNVLRLADALPFFYTSGLISLVRTGPRRRQRIGDVAARTTVVLEPDGKILRTPGWLLPAVTLLATLLSAAIIIPVLSAHSPSATDLLGSGGPGDTPVEGVFQASGRTVSAVGYGRALAPSARWTVRHVECSSGSLCGLTLVDEVGSSTFTAPLLRTSRAWVAVFPAKSFSCAYADGQLVYWDESKVIALRFTDGGRAAVGEERDVWQGSSCGSAEVVREWSARSLGSS